MKKLKKEEKWVAKKVTWCWVRAALLLQQLQVRFYFLFFFLFSGSYLPCFFMLSVHLLTCCCWLLFYQEWSCKIIVLYATAQPAVNLIWFHATSQSATYICSNQGAWLFLLFHFLLFTCVTFLLPFLSFPIFFFWIFLLPLACNSHIYWILISGIVIPIFIIVINLINVMTSTVISISFYFLA